MTADEFARRFQEMNRDQDRAAEFIVPAVGEDLMRGVKLCGGTALSRFYLRHRLSYDLDFFVPEGLQFDASALADSIASKVRIRGLEMTHDGVKADQLHFFVPLPDRPGIKMSFVEDMYARTFPPRPSGLALGGVELQTESVEGLYHRKLRTVVGWARSDALMPIGGRQTARDMFDLFVLSQSVMPLLPFVESLPYAFPLEAFASGIAAMPWFDIAEELAQTIAAPQWQSGTDVGILRDHLFRELGMSELPLDEIEEAPSAPHLRSGGP